MFAIKEYTEINSVSGNEGRIRKRILDDIKPYADDIKVDSMGNIIAFKKGTSDSSKKIILAAHMDEVGFIVSDITEDGFVKFKEVGGIDPRILLAQRVVIGDNNISGVMGIKAVHLQSPEERKSVIKLKDMYIDIGAKSKEEAEKLVNKGDYVAFDSDYKEFGDNIIKAKALDDRAGCAVMTQLIKESYDADIYFCFTVQEVTGTRGAMIASRAIGADVAIILEGTTCSDTAGVKEHEHATSFGSGPVLSLMDYGSYSDMDLNRFIINLAKENDLKFQFKRTINGGNDARAFQTASVPCKTAAISVPCRYIHSPVSCANKDDIEKTYELVFCVMKNIHKF